MEEEEKRKRKRKKKRKNERREASALKRNEKQKTKKWRNQLKQIKYDFVMRSLLHRSENSRLCPPLIYSIPMLCFTKQNTL